jgi:cystinosin
VRFNDVAFAVHAVILCILTYSQFWPALWGFKVGRLQAVSKPVAGIFWGSVSSVVIVVLLVATRGIDGGRDPSGWAWIDVVRCP